MENQGVADERTALSKGRFTSADAASVLERLQDSPLLAEGKINMVSLAAVAARMGTKWPLRHDLVYDHFERAVARHAGPAHIALRLSDTEYLVTQPDATQLVGQVTCLSALRETITHFLGEAQLLDIVVHRITRLSPDAVYGERLDVAVVEENAAAEARVRSSSKPASAFSYRWSPFTATDGRELNVACRLELVINLKTLRVIGHRVASEVVDTEGGKRLSERELGALRRSDLERIDFATVQAAIGQLRGGAHPSDPTLILPVSHITLCSLKGRSVLSDLYKEAQAIVQHGLITEIWDIEGVPSGRLLESLAFVKPFSLYVIGRLTESAVTQSLGTLKHAGLQGLSIECPATVVGDAELMGWLRQRQGILKSIGRTGIVYGLPVLLDGAVAAKLGITHGSVRGAEKLETASKP